MSTPVQKLCLLLPLLLVLSGQADAFGAGNIASISRIEGQNWRHGDIEDALLTLFLARVAGGRKFSKLDVRRSGYVDVGTLKYVSAEAISILIWVLGFLSFGYGTREFEVTTERLGCYEPTEHIDNPLGYAEGKGARDYDRRLRGPVDEERELSIDPRTGLKNYIAREDIDIATSASFVRRVFHRSVQLGRQYTRSRNEEDLHEALRLLGTGLHCLEDYAAHSNYTELSLIELGESNVFPHVGRNTKVELHSAQNDIYPIVTGTFGGVDFFHSVLGELSDKVTQSEVQSLDGVIADSQSGTPFEGFIQDLLSKIPAGLIGDSEGQAIKMREFKAQSENARENSHSVSPREPEEWTRHLDEVHQQIYPVRIPILPGLVEQIQEQITMFVFSVLAPYVLPIIKQVKVELQTGSSEVIQSSREQQHIDFDDDNSSNPTHSMLSKDHFANVLNEPAGRIASQIIKTLDRIILGVFHHSALREYGEDGAADVRQIMFRTVEEWWHAKTEEERDYLREQLTRQGVFEGKNHKEGVYDTGHGCGKPLTLCKGNHNISDEPSGSTLEGLVSGLVGSVGSLLLKDSGARSSIGAAGEDISHRHGTFENPEEQQHQYGQQSPYQEASLREDWCPRKDRYEDEDEGELCENRPSYNFESSERRENRKRDDYNQYTPRPDISSQPFYSDGDRYHYGRPVRGEYGGESIDSHDGNDGHFPYRDTEMQNYEDGRPYQVYTSQYNNTQGGHGGFRGDEYDSQEDGADHYSRNDDYTGRQYEYGRRYDAELGG
ncbi:heterokaryon incompatibility protein Het-C-domain-containing protein [Aspergillus alliaceus]|uniref:Heterokaryon incompatibility protein Het-C-domain-containing protein n=1 Tax=Petromyces alliaceus TaxID=209559 RepID=A0A5N7BZB2_PETAA|nr:heterokaryon incompatibility protein Het-C-domain-containing protein [Aspergillus alliaceus]